jgi:hypothetical protein
LNTLERRIIMATPTKTPQAGKRPVIVTIYSIDNAIVVDPPKFVVSKKHKEEVQWHCGLKHTTHNSNGCFRAHFDQDSPFTRSEFRKHKELTGPSKETAVIGKEYKYTVEIEGYPPLDPIGVVKS